MNIENDLMKPRYKIINDYPGRRETMPVGHILTLDKWGAGMWWHEFSEDEPIHIDEGSKKYPAILKPLQWWEERKERPAYVKCISQDSKIMPGEVLKVRWGTVWGMDEKNRAIVVNTNCFLPATEQEYNEYLKTKTP